MSIIAIKDLKEATTLQRTAMRELCGGVRHGHTGVSSRTRLANNETSVPGAAQTLDILRILPPPPPPPGVTFGVDQGKWE